MAADTTQVTPSGLDVFPPIVASGGGGGTVTSVTAGDETIIIGGTATDPTVRSNSTDVLITSVNLVPGKLVNVFNNSGVPTLRLADASLGQGYHADGFVVDTVTAGNTAKIYTTGMNTHVSGLTPGQAFLGTNGDPTSTPDNTVGHISQIVGVATSATELALELEPDILIATINTTGGLILKDHGSQLGVIATLDVEGTGLVATISGSDGTITGSGGSGQPVTLYVYMP